jgi:hypothetical protein
MDRMICPMAENGPGHLPCLYRHRSRLMLRSNSAGPISQEVNRFQWRDSVDCDPDLAANEMSVRARIARSPRLANS